MTAAGGTGSDMTVRLMTKADTVPLSELEQVCFSEPWSAGALCLFCDDRGFGVVAQDGGGHIVSYCTVQVAPGEGMIVNVATSPLFRRRGAARAVMERVLREAGERGLTVLSLEVRVSNEAAVSLYRSLGFCVAGVRRRFYRDPPEDAYVMILNREG